MSPALDDIAYRAKDQPHACFTALAHHLTMEFLDDTWQQLNQHGAPGLSGETMDAYDRVRRTRIPTLVETLKAHAYRVPPIRRVYIPKAGQPQKRRPLGIPEVEDRLLQAAVNRLLQPIYEADFVEGSYGFRPGRSPHDALGALQTTMMTRPMQWVFEADIRGFFDHLQREWLMTMLRERIGDPGILRLIAKWLHAPIVEPDGHRSRPTEGAPQGGPLSPMLGNVYLHYALDLWLRRPCGPSVGGKRNSSALRMTLWWCSSTRRTPAVSRRRCRGGWPSSDSSSRRRKLGWCPSAGTRGASPNSKASYLHALTFWASRISVRAAGLDTGCFNGGRP